VVAVTDVDHWWSSVVVCWGLSRETRNRSLALLIDKIRCCEICLTILTPRQLSDQLYQTDRQALTTALRCWNLRHTLPTTTSVIRVCSYLRHDHRNYTIGLHPKCNKTRYVSRFFVYYSSTILYKPSRSVPFLVACRLFQKCYRTGPKNGYQVPQRKMSTEWFKPRLISSRWRTSPLWFAA
jgi:hypothetical protein